MAAASPANSSQQACGATSKGRLASSRPSGTDSPPPLLEVVVPSGQWWLWGLVGHFLGHITCSHRRQVRASAQSGSTTLRSHRASKPD